MGAHPMVPADYATPDTVRALDDATRVGGAIAGILAAAIAAHVGFRRWWHRKRDRQERLLREEMKALKDSLHERLDSLHEDIREVRASQEAHLEAHVEGRT